MSNKRNPALARQRLAKRINKREKRLNRHPVIVTSYRSDGDGYIRTRKLMGIKRVVEYLVKQAQQ